MYVMADDRTTADRGRAVEAALANIEKKFGKGSIMRLGEREVSDIPAISTTSLSLDAAIGVGGVPRGRIVEIYGPESSGKTTLALHIVAEAQKAGGVAAYIDAEHAMDADYAGKLGVDVDQSRLGPHVLTSALIRMDVAVFDTIERFVGGTLETGGTSVFALRNGGVGLGSISPEVPPSIVAEIERVTDEIVAGTISIPTSIT